MRIPAAAKALAAPALAAGLVAGGACGPPGGALEEAGGGDPERGRELISRYGCGACHTIPGVPGADAVVGPPLDRFSQRTFIAGRVVNSPETLERWIQDPQHVEPRTAMPDLDVDVRDARDMAAYLHSLR